MPDCASSVDSSPTLAWIGKANSICLKRACSFPARSLFNSLFSETGFRAANPGDWPPARFSGQRLTSETRNTLKNTLFTGIGLRRRVRRSLRTPPCVHPCERWRGLRESLVLAGVRLRCLAGALSSLSVRTGMACAPFAVCAATPSGPASPWPEAKSCLGELKRARSGHHACALAHNMTRSSSSCANVSLVASAAPVPAASRASFDG